MNAQPLAVFEEKSVVTRERIKRTFISTVTFIILIVIQTNTGILPTALAALLLLAVLFVGLLFFASLMKLAFMRRSRLEIYPDHVTYHRRNKSTEYVWSTIRNFDVQVLREAENLNMDYAERSAVDTYKLFQSFFRVFVGDPPNYTLNLEFADSKINMVEIAGDYQFLVKDLPAFVHPIWLDSIQKTLANGNTIPLADVTLTPTGIQKKKDMIVWGNIKHEWNQVDDVRQYIFRNSAKEAGFLNANIITQLPEHSGEILIATIKQQTGQTTP